jgi:hypothetical protein
MGTHIHLLGNIYRYGSYPGDTLESTSPPLPISFDGVLELLKEHILNSRLYFRLLCDHLMSMRLMGIHVMTITSFMSLPCAQDTGGENPYIDTKDVLKLLIVGDSAVSLLVTLGARSAS